MSTESLFAKALGLSNPWKVSKVVFSPEEKRLDITIDFPRGSTFTCPVCGASGAKPYDSNGEQWHHLNFFQYMTYLHARVPRVKCLQGCGIKKVKVPWARPGSGFTLLFEALIMALVKEMTVAAAAKLVGEHDTRLWRIVHHYVDEARKDSDFSGVRRVGIDETASRRGHNYISLFVDLDRKCLLFGTEGRGAGTVGAFKEDLKRHGGKPSLVSEVCCDMSPAFISGVSEAFNQAEITFDRFHIMKLIQEAVDKVRREEAKTTDLLKKTRYLWLKNPRQLTLHQQAKLDHLSHHKLNTGRAYRIKLSLQEFFHQPNRQAGEEFLKRWYFWATHSRLQPVIEAARAIKRHWDGILNWFDSHLSTGFLEGINSLIQAAKAKARGYRTTRNLIAMAYLIAGKLPLSLPT